eukprot:7877505-Pyramimonas_sp.AAC.3
MYLTDGALVGQINANQKIDDRIPLQALHLPKEWLGAVYGEEAINALSQQEGPPQNSTNGRRRLAQIDFYITNEDAKEQQNKTLQNATFENPEESFQESMSRPYTSLEVDFAVLPHTGHVYLRVLWEVRGTCCFLLFVPRDVHTCVSIQE